MAGFIEKFLFFEAECLNELFVGMTSQYGPTSNQCWNNVVYFNVGIYNIEQRQINVEYFNADVSNVRQRWNCQNNIVLFNIKFHNVGQRWNNVAKMNISKKSKKNHIKFNTLNSKF